MKTKKKVVKTTKKAGKKKPQKVLRKTIKSKIQIPDETLAVLFTLSDVMIGLWNLAHAQIREWRESNKESRDRINQRISDSNMDEEKAKRFRERAYSRFLHSINPFALNYWLTPTRSKHHFIGSVSSDLCQQVVKILMSSFDSYWALWKKGDTNARAPRPFLVYPNTTGYRRFVTLAWQTAKIKDGEIHLPALDKKRISIKLPKSLLERVGDKNVKFVKLYQTRKGDFYISLVCASELIEPVENPNFIRSIDLGAGDIAVSDSDGTDFLIPARRPDKMGRRSIRVIEAKMRTKKKGSNRYKKFLESRRKAWNHISLQHKDYQRKLAEALCELKVQAIVIGKPHTRLGLAQSDDGTADQHFGAQNTGYMHQLMKFISEKAAERGILLIEVSDPPRVGSIDNPESKLIASRTMLQEQCDKYNIPCSRKRIRKGFKFVAGKKRRKEMSQREIATQ